MVERTMLITAQQGLHARPAAAFVSAAGRYASEIQLEVRGQTASAKTIFGVLKLGIRQGDQLTIRVSGHDEQAALDGLVSCLEALSKEG